MAGIGGTYDLGAHLLFAGVHQGHALPGYSAATKAWMRKNLWVLKLVLEDRYLASITNSLTLIPKSRI